MLFPLPKVFDGKGAGGWDLLFFVKFILERMR
jgi:hypothetical protein